MSINFFCANVLFLTKELRHGLTIAPKKTIIRMAPTLSTSRGGGGHNGSQSSMLDIFNENEHEVSTIDHEVSAIRTVVEKASSVLIKMDLEGGEVSALEGAVETIEKYRPLLAISVYHRIDHLIRIPIWISRNFAGYRFYLRHHSPSLDETVLYCEPSDH